MATTRNEPVDFAILTAIAVERKAVCAALGFGKQNRVSRNSRIYWKGEVSVDGSESYTVVVAQCPDVASVDAALATTNMLNDWEPRAALLVGIAASATSHVRLGDVVVGKAVHYYERGKEGADGSAVEPYMVYADTMLWNHICAASDWGGEVPIARPDHSKVRPQVHQGIIASGEKVIASAAAREAIVSENRKICAIEMEGFGFSRATTERTPRVPHLVIRGISDDASENKTDDWHDYAAASAAAFALHFIADRPLPITDGKHASARKQGRYAISFVTVVLILIVVSIGMLERFAKDRKVLSRLDLELLMPPLVGSDGGIDDSGAGDGSVKQDDSGADNVKRASVKDTGSKPPTVRFGSLSVDGGLSQQVVQRMVNQNSGAVRLCYENGLHRNRSLQGRISVRFAIARNGSVSAVGNGGSDLNDSATEKCVLDVFKGLVFPSPENGIVTVVCPIVFNAGSGY